MPNESTHPTKTLYQAFLKAQQAMGPVFKNATNPHFKSRYADLAAIVETITEPLQSNGLIVYQPLVIIDGKQYLKTILVHAETGEQLESLAEITCTDLRDPQKVGAAITYYRRYSLLAMFGLSPEDDDGNRASTPPAGSSQTSPQPNPSAASRAPEVRPGDVQCEVPGCTNTIWKSKEEANRRYHDGHVICFNHSTAGDWKDKLAGFVDDNDPDFGRDVA